MRYPLDLTLRVKLEAMSVIEVVGGPGFRATFATSAV